MTVTVVIVTAAAPIDDAPLNSSAGSLAQAARLAEAAAAGRLIPVREESSSAPTL